MRPQAFLSRLWRDEHSRAVIVQIVAVVLLFATAAYLVRNAIVNLEAIGKGFSFAYLWEPASYDINQHLIEYSSRSTHFRAMLVGILNTLLVAVSGIVLATVLGFLLGVLRLSKNLLANKLAQVYIDFVRNVPVLLHILFVYGIIINTFPTTREAMSLGNMAFLTNRGFFVPKPFFEPIFMVVLGILAAGVVFAIWFRRYASKIQKETGKQYPVFWILLGAILGVPLVCFFLLGAPITFEVPEFAGFNFTGGMVVRPEFTALWLALSLYTAAFIAEIVRAGILAVNYGQTEASLSLGINRGKTLDLIVIPQALRVIVPPLTSQYLNLTKNSSLAIAVGYMDIVATIGGISLNQTGREMECMTIVLILYLLLSLFISVLMNLYNKRIRMVER